MNETGSPEDPRDRGQRQKEIVARLIDGDGDPADEVSAELADLLRDSPADRETLVEQLLLDSLLRDELGSESLSALVDVVADGEPGSQVRAAETQATDDARSAAITGMNGMTGMTGMTSLTGRSRPRHSPPRANARRWHTLGWAGAAVVGLATSIIGVALRPLSCFRS